MARPQSPDYDKRRDAIVAAAAQLYARRGFDGTSIAELAKAGGFSKSLVYHYFPSKEDILDAVMEEHLDALVEEAETASRAGGADTQLRALARGFLRRYVGAEDRHKVLLNELDKLAPERRAAVVAKQRRIIATVEGLIATLNPERAAEALPLAMLFFGMINWTHTWFRPKGPTDTDRLADMAVERMLA
ncbi:TetR/AcrR family transcriptional regulator [Allosphingosinicella indica]|nr:TetR/AcrR family transcriptional regulator [Allosphingosinicella indica]